MAYYIDMKVIEHFKSRGTIIPYTLMASAIVGFFTLSGLYLIPGITTPTTSSMYLEPGEITVALGDTFTVDVMVSVPVPVNAFTGVITFDESVLAVSSIEYATSIADLWVKEPWYSQGAGTINFTGGTTARGGFNGKGALLSIKFKAIGVGNGRVAMSDTRILENNGQGSDVLLTKQIDTIFAVTSTTVPDIKESKLSSPAKIKIVTSLPNTDLNNDNATTFADLSIFMVDIAKGNPQADFNGDGKVNMADLSILLIALRD